MNEKVNGNFSSSVKTPDKIEGWLLTARAMEYRVLVVDDSSIQRLIARRFVERWGATVDVACDGIEAATLALCNSYQIVIMDIHHGTEDISLAGKVAT